MSNRRRATGQRYIPNPPPPPDPDVPPEVDALLVCLYEFLGMPYQLNFIGWLKSHGFRFIASPASLNGEKQVTCRTKSGDTITVSVSLDREHIAEACKAIRARRQGGHEVDVSEHYDTISARRLSSWPRQSGKTTILSSVKYGAPGPVSDEAIADLQRRARLDEA